MSDTFLPERKMARKIPKQTLQIGEKTFFFEAAMFMAESEKISYVQG